MAFSFGTKAPTFSTPGATGTAAPSAFSLGLSTPQQQQQPGAMTGFSFGTPAASVPASTATTSSAFSFNPAASTTTTGVTFGTAPTAAPQASQPSAFSFGGTATAPATSVPTLGATSTAQPFTGFGLTASSAPSTLTTSQPSTLVSGSTLGPSSYGGLGGVPSSGATDTTPGGFGFASGLSTAKATDGRAVKELPVPPEIMQVVEELKVYMKNHKVKMTEMGRASDKNIDKVVEEIEDARLAISNLTNLVHKQGLICASLMKEIQEEMKNIDMAMVTRDTPLVLQNEITSPTSYFYRLVNNYQDRMLLYKREIERAEIALGSLVESQGFSSKDLISALQGTKETVMALAAKVQDLHEQVVSELITHRNLKRFAVGDGRSEWLNGARGRSVSMGGPMSSPLGHETRGSITRMDPVIPANYHRVYDKVNVLFNTPPKIGDMSSSLTYRPGSIASTPVFPRPGFSSPPSLFQTGCSTILGSPAVNSGSGLKRSKR